MGSKHFNLSRGDSLFIFKSILDSLNECYKRKNMRKIEIPEVDVQHAVDETNFYLELNYTVNIQLDEIDIQKEE